MTFQQALKAVIPHASTDKSIPALNAVQIHHDRVIATDRYSIAVSYYEPLHDEDKFVIDLAQAKDLAKVKGDAIYIGTDSIQIGTTTVEPHLVRDDYPKVENLFPTSEPEPLTDILIGLKDLNKFKINDLRRNNEERNQSLKFTFYGVNKPILVNFSDHFKSLVMPRRI